MMSRIFPVLLASCLFLGETASSSEEKETASSLKTMAHESEANSASRWKEGDVFQVHDLTDAVLSIFSMIQWLEQWQDMRHKYHSSGELTNNLRFSRSHDIFKKVVPLFNHKCFAAAQGGFQEPCTTQEHTLSEIFRMVQEKPFTQQQKRKLTQILDNSFLNPLARASSVYGNFGAMKPFLEWKKFGPIDCWRLSMLVLFEVCSLFNQCVLTEIPLKDAESQEGRAFLGGLCYGLGYLKNVLTLMRSIDSENPELAWIEETIKRVDCFLEDANEVLFPRANFPVKRSLGGGNQGSDEDRVRFCILPKQLKALVRSKAWYTFLQNAEKWIPSLNNLLRSVRFPFVDQRRLPKIFWGVLGILSNLRRRVDLPCKLPDQWKLNVSHQEAKGALLKMLSNAEKKGPFLTLGPDLSLTGYAPNVFFASQLSDGHIQGNYTSLSDMGPTVLHELGHGYMESLNPNQANTEFLSQLFEVYAIKKLYDQGFSSWYSHLMIRILTSIYTFYHGFVTIQKFLQQKLDAPSQQKHQTEPESRGELEKPLIEEPQVASEAKQGKNEFKDYIAYKAMAQKICDVSPEFRLAHNTGLSDYLGGGIAMSEAVSSSEEGGAERCDDYEKGLVLAVDLLARHGGDIDAIIKNVNLWGVNSIDSYSSVLYECIYILKNVSGYLRNAGEFGKEDPVLCNITNDINMSLKFGKSPSTVDQIKQVLDPLLVDAQKASDWEAIAEVLCGCIEGEDMETERTRDIFRKVGAVFSELCKSGRVSSPEQISFEMVEELVCKKTALYSLTHDPKVIEEAYQNFQKNLFALFPKLESIKAQTELTSDSLNGESANLISQNSTGELPSLEEFARAEKFQKARMSKQSDFITVLSTLYKRHKDKSPTLSPVCPDIPQSILKKLSTLNLPKDVTALIRECLKASEKSVSVASGDVYGFYDRATNQIFVRAPNKNMARVLVMREIGTLMALYQAEREIPTFLAPEKGKRDIDLDVWLKNLEEDCVLTEESPYRAWLLLKAYRDLPIPGSLLKQYVEKFSESKVPQLLSLVENPNVAGQGGEEWASVWEDMKKTFRIFK